MDLSRIGEAALIAREGRRLETYKDSVGIWTIGVGHTAAAGAPAPRSGLRIAAAECDAIFARDVKSFVKTVRDNVPADLPQHSFDALASLLQHRPGGIPALDRPAEAARGRPAGSRRSDPDVEPAGGAHPAPAGRI